MKLKDKDFLLLDCLLDNSRCSLLHVSKKLGIPLNTVYSRIKKLVEAKVILGFSSLINPLFLRHSMNALLVVETMDISNDCFSNYGVNSIIKLDKDCYLIELFFSNIFDLKNFVSSLKGIGKVKHRFFVKDCLKRNGFLFTNPPSFSNK